MAKMPPRFGQTLKSRRGVFNFVENLMVGEQERPLLEATH